jgi:hypothetical protein
MNPVQPIRGEIGATVIGATNPAREASARLQGNNAGAIGRIQAPLYRCR